MQTYGWRPVGGAKRKQAGASADVLRFVQNFLYSFCDFFIGKLDVYMPQRIVNTAVYSHIKPERRLRGSILQDIQQRARSTPVKPLARKVLSLDNWGAYLLLSLPV